MTCFAGIAISRVRVGGTCHARRQSCRMRELNEAAKVAGPGRALQLFFYHLQAIRRLI